MISAKLFAWVNSNQIKEINTWSQNQDTAHDFTRHYVRQNTMSIADNLKSGYQRRYIYMLIHYCRIMFY